MPEAKIPQSSMLAKASTTASIKLASDALRKSGEISLRDGVLTVRNAALARLIYARLEHASFAAADAGDVDISVMTKPGGGH